MSGSILGPYQPNSIHCGECSELMRKLPATSIDLVITSPPYDDLRDYKGYTFNYKEIACELFRVVKDSGVVVWVVGDTTKDFCESLTSFKQAIYFVERVGFNLLDTMICYKNGPARYEKNKQSYSGTFEYMFVFSKGKPKTFNAIKDKRNLCQGRVNRGRDRKPDGILRTKWSAKNGAIIPKYGYRSNVWRYEIGLHKTTKDLFAYDHPAMFPEALARDHIITWSNPNDVILDPMCGSGTVLKMAKETGRQFLGFDISSEYVELSKLRVQRGKTPLFEMR